MVEAGLVSDGLRWDLSRQENEGRSVVRKLERWTGQLGSMPRKITNSDREIIRPKHAVWEQNSGFSCTYGNLLRLSRYVPPPLLIPPIKHLWGRRGESTVHLCAGFSG